MVNHLNGLTQTPTNVSINRENGTTYTDAHDKIADNVNIYNYQMCGKVGQIGERGSLPINFNDVKFLVKQPNESVYFQFVS